MRTLAILTALVLGGAGAPAPLLAGSLEPPGAPAATMKSIEQVEPRTPISSLPYTIGVSGSYYLARSLTATGPGDGITVNAASATLDLNGFTLDGAGIAGNGIVLAAPSSAGHYVVRNGTVTGWRFGITQLIAGPYLELRDLVVRSGSQTGIVAWDVLVSHCTINFNGGAGLSVAVGAAIVRDSRIAGNNRGGLELTGSQGNLVADCIVDGNRRFGLKVGNYTSIRRCTVTNTAASDGFDGSGIAGGSGILVTESTISGNARFGVDAGTNSLVAGNNIFGNGGSGATARFGTRLESNNVTSNGGYGIVAPTGDGFAVVRNAAVANAQGNYFVTAPFFTWTGNPGSFDPWVNFSY